MSSQAHRIVAVHLDERMQVRRSPQVEHERKAAIFDLIEENEFEAEGDGVEGPYALHLGIQDKKLVFDLRSPDETPITAFVLSLSPFRRIIRDYFAICDSYYAAIKTMTPNQIEAIDMGRRGLHNEGAVLLRERLSGKAAMDEDTARRLFTLICVLHLGPNWTP